MSKGFVGRETRVHLLCLKFCVANAVASFFVVEEQTSLKQPKATALFSDVRLQVIDEGKK